MAMLRLRRICVGMSMVLVALAQRGALGADTKGGSLANYISPDFCAAVVIHPERIAQSPLAAAVKSAFPSQGEAADLSSMVTMAASQGSMPPGMDAAQLAQLLKDKPVHRVVLLIDPMPVPGIPAGPGLILQFGADVDGKAILTALSKDWKAADTQGTAYQTLKNPEAGKPDIAACVVDARMILVGLEPTVLKMLAKPEDARPLLDQLRKTSLNHDVVVEFLAEPLLTKYAQSTGKSTEEALKALGEQAAMAKDVKSLSATMNCSGKTLFHAELVTAKAESAGMLGMLATMGLNAGKEKFEVFKKDPPPMPPTVIEPLKKLGDEVLKSLSIKNDGPRLVVDLPMPAALPDALKAAGEMAAMAKAASTPPKK